MKIATVIAAAVLALTATSASAGGFKYGSLGGNYGTFANINGGSFGSAKVSSYGKRCRKGCRSGGSTSSETYLEIKSYKTYNSAGAYGSTGNQSSFKGFGRGTAHSQSGLTASAGVGYGIGGQIGGFKKVH